MKPRFERIVAPTTRALLNMSSPPRTKVEVRQEPISGSILVFDLAHALMLQRALRPALHWRDVDLKTVQQLARDSWQSDVPTLLRDIDHSVYEALPNFLGVRRGALLGWTADWQEVTKSEQYFLCIDVALTIAVLARRVGDLLLCARPPEASWERLFGALFAVDDERFAGVAAARICVPLDPLLASALPIPNQLPACQWHAVELTAPSTATGAPQ